MTSARKDLEIVVYHIGGEDSYGPIESILQRMSKHVRLVIFDARTDTNDTQTVDHMVQDGIPVSIVRVGISDSVGKAAFYVNKWPLSSSLFPCSPLAANEDPDYAHVHTWGENAELDHVIQVDTTTIDNLVAAGELPPPDVLSMDIQGAELATLHGAAKSLAEDILCVVAEVEFFEIYRGQGLFDGQMSFLADRGFRLFDLVNPQRWHPGPRIGRGFLTFSEAISLKCVKNIPKDDRGCVAFEGMSNERLIRLAAIAFSFDALSYTVELLSVVRSRDSILYESLRADEQYGPLVDLCDLSIRHRHDYLNDKDFLRNMIELREGRFVLRMPPKSPTFLERLKGVR